MVHMNNYSNAKPVRVRLFGGLGNQLFQYFAGLYLSKNLETTLEIDYRWIEDKYSHVFSDLRDFKFTNEAQSITTEKNGRVNFLLERMKTKFILEFPIFNSITKMHAPIIPGYVDMQSYLQGQELRGYYQSYKYFEDSVGNAGMQDWTLINESSKFLILKKYLKTKKFIAIHVRGGDYLNSIYSNLDFAYYEEALKQIKYLLGDLDVVVFTNDIQHAKQIFKAHQDLEFLNQEGLRASEAMILMSYGDGIVTANSTFSYWAAMINNSINIVAPLKWYKTKSVDRNFYPLNWKLL
jgi:hypothetical protein